MSVHAVKSGCTYHDKMSASFEQVAAQVRINESDQSPGIMFARKIHGGQPEQQLLKNEARKRVQRHFSRYAGHLKLFTLPGLKWAFERDLLNHRRYNRPTTIYAAEVDAAIYRASLLSMPHKGALIQVPHDNLVYRSETVNWFEHGRIEDMILRTTSKVTGAWLDLTGPVTDRMNAALRVLWPRITDSIVITFLGARFVGEVNEEINRSDGDWQRYFARLLNVPASHVLLFSYCDPVKMIQATIMKPSCIKRLAKESPMPPSSEYRVVQGILIDWPLQEVRADGRYQIRDYRPSVPREEHPVRQLSASSKE